MSRPGIRLAAPPGLVRNAVGDPALRAWLDRLGELAGSACRRLDVEPTGLLPAQYSVAMTVRRPDGSSAVLKLIPPDDFAALEVPALRAYDGTATPRLLEYAEDLDAVLMERVGPAVPLTSVTDDDRATAVLAGVLRRLWSVPATRLRPGHRLTTWARQRPDIMRSRARQHPDVVPRHLLDEATETLREWDDSAADVILHGDLHHGNVLSCDRRDWVAIDPSSRIGRREADVAAMLRNPWGAVRDVGRLRARHEWRLRVLHDMLGLDVQRCRRWAFANSLDLAIWSVVSGRDDDAEYLFAVALSLSEAGGR